MLFNNFVSQLKIDNNENEFISKREKYKLSFNNSNNILIQQSTNYNFLAKVSDIVRNINPSNISLVNCETVVIKKNEVIFLIPIILRFLRSWIVFSKLNKIYFFLSFDKVYYNISLFSFLSNIILALKHYLKNLSKTYDDFTLYEIKVGDLIVDSYIRFYNKKSFNSKDFNIYFLILNSLNYISLFKKILKEYKPNKYILPYSSYINHGIGVRYLLKNNVKVYTTSLSNFKVKKLSLLDPLHIHKHWSYNPSLKITNEQRETTKIMLDKRFSGKTKLLYLKESPYKSISGSESKLERFECIIFLPDFMDNVNCYRNFLFVDFYDWFTTTVKFCREINLKIGVKPHFNQVIESSKVVEKLMQENEDLVWIPKNYSNNILFQQKLKFCVSPYGSILSELAYHNIIPICAGDHPAANFNFVFQGKNLDNYEYLIKNSHTLKFEENHNENIIKFYFQHEREFKPDLKINKEFFNIINNHPGDTSILKLI